MADVHQDLASIVNKLNDTEVRRDVRLVRSHIYEILALATNGGDVTAALPTVVKLLAHTDIFVKRVVGELMAIYAEQVPEMVLLATNTLVQDCQDVNPLVRGHGLRVLASLQSHSTVEMLTSAVCAGLEDSSPYVRRSAALASVSLHRVSPASVTEGRIWDLLYTHLSDSDSATVASCLCALEEIFAKEKGIVISNKLGHYLISKLALFTPTVQRFVLQFLLKHSPKSKVQMFDHLNDLDESLSKSSSLATTLCSLELFCHLASDLSKVRSKAYSNAWLAIKTNLARERSEEVVTAVIDYLCTTGFPVDVLVQDYTKFFCRDDESIFLIRQKIRMLSRLITPDNAESILEELARSARHLCSGTLREMVESVVEAMSMKPEIEESCVVFFKKLLQLGNADFLDCVIQLLPTVTFSNSQHWLTLAPCIQDNYQQIQSVSGKVALLEIIRAHGSLLRNAPEILEQMLWEQEEKDSDKEEHMQKRDVSSHHTQQRHHSDSQKLKLTLLGAMVKMCFEHPGKLQPLLAKLMEQCIKDENRHVRDRALFLYGYLLGRVKREANSSLICL
ncbi:unnamed protein product [Candidula unifasciata]|uniref:Clathrin/coatomer adaptor adaptin-like N-terminal domain-containing protein n=1 Tax=Candidula unifasciata TaxID=100452 RepID=A0A8S3Z4P1_9EUPU|nr:unnamed protein product [Candidula unifasciata]